MNSVKAVWAAVSASLRDLLPIIVVIGFFQLAVLQQPIPNFGEIALGILFVVIGLTLFVQGLNMGLFPIGETMALTLRPIRTIEGTSSMTARSRISPPQWKRISGFVS